LLRYNTGKVYFVCVFSEKEVRMLKQYLIRAFQFKPTLIVRSGGGFHLYWRLKEPYEKDDIPAIEKTNGNLTY
jgi:DNA primase catalytic subunit